MTACVVCGYGQEAHVGGGEMIHGFWPEPPATPPEPPATAHLPHYQVPESSLCVTGVPVIEVTSAVLCPDCLGDWCSSCNHTGMAQPANSPQATATQLPGGVVGEAPAAGVDLLAAAVERWAFSLTHTQEDAA